VRVFIEVHEGQVARNLLENNLLEMLTEGGAAVTLITSGARVPEFIGRYQREGVECVDLLLLMEGAPSRWENYEYTLGRMLTRRGMRSARQLLWDHVGERLADRLSDAARDLFAQRKPDVVVATHLSQVYGRRIIAAARRRGIRTVGNVNSWDNVWKGLRVRPETVTCWSENNRDEIIKLEGYAPEQVQVIGAPAFDPYFAPDAQWTREQLCARLGLDASRPYVLFATLGQFSQQIDETYPLEWMLKAIDDRAIQGNPQVVLRMHPWSRDIYFKRWMDHPNVVISRYETYYPGLGWTPTRDEAVLAGNLMKHASAVVSPGSTMCIEAAIFDVPTIIPVFNAYMPEIFESYFKQTWLNQHFGRIYKNDWSPILRDERAAADAINRALTDRAWYAEGRKAIREMFLGPLDGGATRRFADVILS